MTADLATLWHTIRHLKAGQLADRVSRRFAGIRPIKTPAPRPGGEWSQWVPPVTYQPSLTAATRIRIHRIERDISAATAWRLADVPSLWLYHLHYFDELCAAESPIPVLAREQLIDRWIAEHPVGSSPGWDPYPTSLRIVNWIKWHLAGHPLGPAALESLALQIGWLANRLEFHLRGNHLFENAKALAFGGEFCSGSIAARHAQRGWKLIAQQLREQVLSDGGHFELSAMYHARMLENVLDLVNLARIRRPEMLDPLSSIALRMLRWLRVLTHPDGDIALFNDAAIGQAPNMRTLSAYARRLGLEASGDALAPLELLESSGYCRMQSGPWTLLLDLANLGPDYLPAHGHADSLTFEASLNGRRLIVDTGTGTYQESPQRLAQRSTSAHNTVVIDDLDSSQVWRSFRVGRRAKVVQRSVEGGAGEWRVTAAHDGYRRSGPGVLHRRTWSIRDRVVSIIDVLQGRGRHEIAARLHLAPGTRVEEETRGQLRVITPTGDRVLIRSDERLASGVEPYEYSPEFGRWEPSLCIVFRGRMELPAEFASELDVRGA